MKHTDFYSLYREIQKREYAELAEAVKAHGGSFSLVDELDGDELPAVSACQISDDEYHDYVITKVENRKSGVRIFGYPKNGWSCEAGELDGVAYGDIEYIIDAIPETEEVQDVTIKTIKTIE